MFQKAVYDLIDREFNGRSWNGPSLMATLEKLDASTAASQATWEGYSAWEIAIHCACCKFIILDDLGITMPEWPYGREHLFGQPEDSSEATWQRDKQLFTLVHERCMQAIKALSPEQLAAEMPSWKAPWVEIITWLTTHDAFHGAQIRSMGLAQLKDKKHD
ncbi:MAG: DinB family protein [Spirochaetes bacterium]|nr:DinB family protein [Spirochaetota bacterium]MBU0953829.1 DinB family protein [Spirochaetota bacterium]